MLSLCRGRQRQGNHSCRVNSEATGFSCVLYHILYIVRLSSFTTAKLRLLLRVAGARPSPNRSTPKQQASDQQCQRTQRCQCYDSYQAENDDKCPCLDQRSAAARLHRRWWWGWFGAAALPSCRHRKLPHNTLTHTNFQSSYYIATMSKRQAL